jgi:hypothetical protein
VALLTFGTDTPRPPALLQPATRRWLFTLAATVLSAYALDAVATAAGLALAASQLLRALDHGLVLLFLAGTYVAWGAGLRVNLQANWALLEDTGTSTNALSKAAYDVAKRRTASVRARRVAAAAAYVATELAKETPYYAGAFGAAIFTDSISANDALVFLGGANLGAAAYEYGLGRAVRAVLARAQRRRDAGRTPARVTGVTPARESPSIHDPIPMRSRVFGQAPPREPQVAPQPLLPAPMEDMRDMSGH